MTDETDPRSLRMSDGIAALAKALIAAQAGLPELLKDKVARTEKFSYSYIGLETVMPAALKALTAQGLGLMQTVGTNGTRTTLTTMLVHESGEWLSDTQALILMRDDPQGQGSAITYGRRYAVMALLGLVADEDDDANAPLPRPNLLRPDAAQGDAWGDPMPAGAPRTSEKLMPLKYAGNCTDCGYKIAVGTQALYNGTTRTVRHSTGECPEGDEPSFGYVDEQS